MGLLLMFGGGGGGAAPVTYATWNVADAGPGMTASGGGLIAQTGNPGWALMRATAPKTYGTSGGKWQYEVTITAGPGTVIVGIANSSAPLASFLGADGNGKGCYASVGELVSNGNANPFGFSTWTTGDVITVLWDGTTGQLYFKKNGGSPVAAGSAFGGTVYPAISLYDTNSAVLTNFGASALTYPEPGYNNGWYL